MAATTNKRRRPNFTTEEVMTLLSGVRERRSQIECPLLTKQSANVKLRAWEAVTAQVCAVSATQRSVEEVRGKYADFKCFTKRKIAAINKQMTGTGDENDKVPGLTPTEEIMLQILNEEVVTDNDALVFDDSDQVLQLTPTEETVSQFISEAIVTTDFSISETEKDTITIQDSNIDCTEKKISIPAVTPTNSKRRRPNFRSIEVMALLSAVKERRNVIESPLSSHLSASDKLAAWYAVTEHVATVSFTKRSMEELRSKYYDFKCHTKRKIAAMQKEMEGTGDSSTKVQGLTPTEEAMAQIINHENAPNNCKITGEKDPLAIQEPAPEQTFKIVRTFRVTDETLDDDGEILDDVTPPPASLPPSLDHGMHQSQETLASHQLEERKPLAILDTPMSPQMLDVQQGILNELRGLRSDLSKIGSSLNFIGDLSRTVADLNETLKKCIEKTSL